MRRRRGRCPASSYVRTGRPVPSQAVSVVELGALVYHISEATALLVRVRHFAWCHRVVPAEKTARLDRMPTPPAAAVVAEALLP